MPFITVKVLEGKTTEQKRELVQKMSELVSDVFEVEKEKIFIFFEDLAPHNYGKHGELLPYLNASAEEEPDEQK
ncbi:tautomerase family protein [Paenibacillus sp. Z6-24]